MEATEIIELTKRALPKWPQMLVYGESVTKKQALEVIRRTDAFFVDGGTGNNPRFENRCFEIVKRPAYKYNKDFDWQAYEKGVEKFSKAWGCIETQYVSNNWVACAFVGGPHGWMHPDGRIMYGDNIGKYPDVTDVFEDWKRIAEAFPFINLDAVLMSGEDCEHEDKDRDLEPIVMFRVRDGKVTIHDPLGPYTPFSSFGVNLDAIVSLTKRDFCGSLASLFQPMGTPDGRTGENAIPLNQIHEWAKQVYGDSR